MTCGNCGSSNTNAQSASSNAVPLRDDGDGSSSSTNADENQQMCGGGQFGRNGLAVGLFFFLNLNGNVIHSSKFQDLTIRSPLSDQTLQYVRSLESRIRQLEEERCAILKNVPLNPTSNGHVPEGKQQLQQQQQQQIVMDPISGRPEAVVRALQVLEVREQLERERIGPNLVPDALDDGEKALVREMCNVVWRKLEDAPNTGIDQHV